MDQNEDLDSGDPMDKYGPAISGESLPEERSLSPAAAQIERLVRMAKRPEFIPQFLEASSRQDTRKARYWLARCMGQSA